MVRGCEKLKTLRDVKYLADTIIDAADQESVFRFGLSLLGVPPDSEEQVMARWHAGNRPSIRDFAPYFTHVFSVDLFFYLAVAADLISRTRRSNKVDLAYLYYLPFCMVFTSSDNFHAATVPLFLRKDQSFVKGMDLKLDLGRLDCHYSSLPEGVKIRGVFHFAAYPPTDSSFLVTRLWDKHLPIWRKHHAESRKPADKSTEDRIVKEIIRSEKEAVPIDPPTQIASDDADYILIKRKVYATKGKWKRFPPEVEKTSVSES